jgi:hypothetical protein
VSEFVFRLWVHGAEDGLLPEIIVQADTQMQAAALALQHFIGMNRALDANSYLQCEPLGSQCLRVQHVLDWLHTTEGRGFSKARGFATPSLPVEDRPGNFARPLLIDTHAPGTSRE